MDYRTDATARTPAQIPCTKALRSSCRISTARGTGEHQTTVKDLPLDPPEAPAADYKAITPLLRVGERIVRFAPRVGIKKFRFNAYLTDRRLILVDCGEKQAGVASKEIPVETISEACLEPGAETDPVLVLTVGAGEDSRKMRLVFVRDEVDRNAEAEEWAGLLSGGQRPAGGEHDEQAARFTGSLLHPHARTYAAERIARKEKPLPERDSGTASPEGGSDMPGTSQGDPFSPGGSAGIDTGVVSSGPVQEERAPHTGPEILYCHNCGKRVPKLSNFCPYCGTRLHRPEPPAEMDDRAKDDSGRFIDPGVLRKILHR